MSGPRDSERVDVLSVGISYDHPGKHVGIYNQLRHEWQSGTWVGGKVRGQSPTGKTEASQTSQGSETTATLRTAARDLWLPWT